MGYTGYMGGYVYFDWTYLLLLVAFVFSMIASVKVKSTYNKYGKIAAKSGLTANDAVRRVLESNGVYGVRMGHVSGDLTDNFNPKTNVISLSDTVDGRNSIAAIGVACHEAGHAVQHDKEYGPAKLRLAIVPITNIGSQLAMPLLLLGLFLGFMGLVYTGIVLYSLCTVFQLVTLSTEFDASRRAMEALEGCGILDEEELKGAKKVLSAAAMTYVAALSVSLLQLLRLIVLVRNRSDD